MKEFDLEGREFIELNKLLKILRWEGTGGEANVSITEGDVFVNEAVEIQKRKKLRVGDIVRFRNNTIKIK
ncbi:MAG: RNA-binding S4 domain-containing protein [Bacteroidales bacterium]|nr:RNA-binding S4 domain-containing protein [Bacteroidales bacterium]